MAVLSKREFVLSYILWLLRFRLPYRGYLFYYTGCSHFPLHARLLWRHGRGIVNVKYEAKADAKAYDPRARKKLWEFSMLPEKK